LLARKNGFLGIYRKGTIKDKLRKFLLKLLKFGIHLNLSIKHKKKSLFTI